MRFSAKTLLLSLLSGMSLHAGAQSGVTDPAAPMAAQLAPGAGAELVAAHCGACHSLNLVTQNRGDRDHWTRLIRWMQDEHNLWDLGAAEDDILSYLASQYGAPDVVPRRPPLKVQWRAAKD